MKSCNGSDEGSEKADMPRKPKVFIGSSSKGKEIADIAKKLLEEGNKIEVEVWDTVFIITETYLERLSRALEEYDFAVLVITVEETELSTMRDNVLFELGLFMGRLGRHRAIMLYDEEQKAILPSGLGGVHRATFSKTKADGDLEVALKSPCDEIRDYILDPYEDKIRVFEVWKKSCHQIYEALEKAPEDATIRIIQTWLPDLEDFIEDIEYLFTEHHKRFKFQILLIDHNKDDNKDQDKCDDDNHFDLLSARIKYRKETHKNAIKKIADSISQFKNLKEYVEEEWIKYGKKDKPLSLNLEIGLYDFLPFGPFYQIGDKVMFVGFYLNYCSSVNAPMVKIHSKAETAWYRFDKHFTFGWENSRKIYPPETKNKKTESLVANDRKK